MFDFLKPIDKEVLAAYEAKKFVIVLDEFLNNENEVMIIIDCFFIYQNLVFDDEKRLA